MVLYKGLCVPHSAYAVKLTTDFQLRPFHKTDPTRIRNFYRAFSHVGDYFILRHPCQATPLDRIKCGFIRPVFVNANDKTNIKREIALTDNFLLFPSHGKCNVARALPN